MLLRPSDRQRHWAHPGCLRNLHEPLGRCERSLVYKTPCHSGLATAEFQVIAGAHAFRSRTAVVLARQCPAPIREQGIGLPLCANKFGKIIPEPAIVEAEIVLDRLLPRRSQPLSVARLARFGRTDVASSAWLPKVNVPMLMLDTTMPDLRGRGIACQVKAVRRPVTLSRITLIARYPFYLHSMKRSLLIISLERRAQRPGGV